MHFRTESLDEVCGQQRNVIAAFGQTRHMGLDQIQAVEKVFTKPPFLDGLLQVCSAFVERTDRRDARHILGNGL